MVVEVDNNEVLPLAVQPQDEEKMHLYEDNQDIVDLDTNVSKVVKDGDLSLKNVQNSKRAIQKKRKKELQDMQQSRYNQD